MTSTSEIDTIFKRIWERDLLIKAKRRELEELRDETHKDMQMLKDYVAQHEEKP